jgi:hypothetical protein
MDAEIETLRKVDALTRSPNKGEAQAARSRLRALLKKLGKTETDLPSILNPPKPVEPPSSPLGNIFGGFDDYMEKQEPGYKDRMAAEVAAKKKEAAAYRKAVIAKYGSEEAAKTPNAMHQSWPTSRPDTRRWRRSARLRCCCPSCCRCAVSVACWRTTFSPTRF